MRKAILTYALILASILSFSAAGQNVSDLIISEIMPASDSGLVDDYGRRNGWIEIYNKSQGTVNFAGCYLTDDRSDLKKCQISKTDSRTRVGPRQVALFYASGDSADGTFYIDFEIIKGMTVYLVSNDGRTVIDSLTVPSDLPCGKSAARVAHDIRQQQWDVAEGGLAPSPMVVNGQKGKTSGSEKLAHDDPHGIVLTVVSISVVFIALLVLWWLFALLGFSVGGVRKEKKASPKKGSGKMTPEVAAAIALALERELGGEVYAAIALAMHRYLNETVHDNESFIITIRHNQSAWNHKEQGFRKSPRH
ncbi:MAG: OadG family transporter subunit [Candidatus Cryptobacteroides sp.]